MNIQSNGSASWIENLRLPSSLLLMVAVTVLIGALSYAPVCAAATSNIYISQNGGGGGTSCSDTLAASWFNNSANWGNGSNQIGPGGTVHLCGIISSSLTIQGSGSTVSPVTILFESGAMMSAPNWGSGAAAITGSGLNYVIIDGGANGVIQATSNGTGLATNYDDTGVSLSSCSNCTVRNLTIANMYVHTCTEPASTCTDESGQNTGGIYVNGGSSVSIYNNTVHDAKWCLFYSIPGGGSSSNIAIYSNTEYHCDHGVAVGAGGASSVLSGAAVYGNVMHDFQNWDDAANDNHHDGIHFWAPNSGDSDTGVQEYDNYMYGDFGVGFNSFLFAEGTQTGALYFNNVLVDQSSVSHAGCGYICLENDSVIVANNTIVGTGTGINIYGQSATVENNTISNAWEAVGINSGATIKVWDYNNYYNLGGCAWNCGTSFQQWQAAGNDVHGSNTNPNLSGNYQPTSNSTALNTAGFNLSGLLIPTLDLDKSGASRPVLPTNWTVGAYQYNGTVVVNPPTNLMASVQ